MTHDERTPAEILSTGRMSKRDAALLRQLSGRQTLAEWIDRPTGKPHRITDRRLLLICHAVATARLQARWYARHAPSALLTPVRRELDPPAVRLAGHPEVGPNVEADAPAEIVGTGGPYSVGFRSAPSS